VDESGDGFAGSGGSGSLVRGRGRGEAVRGQINGWGTNWMATNAAFAGDTPGRPR
jgi:hypothetical protein